MEGLSSRRPRWEGHDQEWVGVAGDESPAMTPRDAVPRETHIALLSFPGIGARYRPVIPNGKCSQPFAALDPAAYREKNIL
jgi:hypothetical protein